MTISRISRLFAANLDTLNQSNTTTQNTGGASPSDSTAAAEPQTEAVKLSGAFAQATEKPESADQSRFEKIRSLVSQGKYTSSSKELATVLIRDLF